MNILGRSFKINHVANAINVIKGTRIRLGSASRALLTFSPTFVPSAQMSLPPSLIRTEDEARKRLSKLGGSRRKKNMGKQSRVVRNFFEELYGWRQRRRREEGGKCVSYV